jgi:hypothetical protein
VRAVLGIHFLVEVESELDAAEASLTLSQEVRRLIEEHTLVEPLGKAGIRFVDVTNLVLGEAA